MNTRVRLEQQQNRSGDPDLAEQGFGRLAKAPPPHFDTDDVDGIHAFFAEHGTPSSRRALRMPNSRT